MGAWPQVRGRLNRLLGGWSAYFGYGTLNAAYRSVEKSFQDERLSRLAISTAMNIPAM
jgi:RNA-directed DNA polymerase